MNFAPRTSAFCLGLSALLYFKPVGHLVNANGVSMAMDAVFTNLNSLACFLQELGNTILG